MVLHLHILIHILTADSLKAVGKGAGAPTKFVSNLQLWLKSAFRKKFKSRGNTLPHAVQEDSFSCGIITLNTLEHAIFSRSLWEPPRAVEERLRWFSRLAETVKTKPTKSPNNSEYVPTPATGAAKRHTLCDLLNPVIELVPPIVVLEKPCDYDSDADTSSKTSASTPSLIDDPPDVGHDDLPVDVESDWQSVVTSALSSRPSLHDNTLSDKMDIESNHSAPGSAVHDFLNTLGLKRPHSEVETESDYNGDSSDSETRKHAKKFIKAGEGTSRSATHSRKQRAQIFDGKFKVNMLQYENWQEKVLKKDPHAKFDENDCRRAWHSVCGKFYTMKEPYDFTRFKDHVDECSNKKTTRVGRAQTLLGMGWATVVRKEEVVPNADEDDDELEEDKCPKVPCPGLTEVNDPRIQQYLKRTGATGGGGRSLAIIAKEKFKKMFSKLQKETSRKKVVDIQMHEWKWRNDHANFRVYATGCEKTVDSREPKPPNPCPACTSVLQSRAFKTAINKKPAEDDKNFKHTNHRF